MRRAWKRRVCKQESLRNCARVIYTCPPMYPDWRKRRAFVRSRQLNIVRWIILYKSFHSSKYCVAILILSAFGYILTANYWHIARPSVVMQFTLPNCIDEMSLFVVKSQGSMQLCAKASFREITYKRTTLHNTSLLLARVFIKIYVI